MPAPGKRMPDPYGDGALYGGGRADVRLAQGGDGELYLLCKTDGWIRKLVPVTAPPPLREPPRGNRPIETGVANVRSLPGAMKARH